MIHHLEKLNVMISPLSGIEPLHPIQATIQFYLSDELTHDLST